MMEFIDWVVDKAPDWVRFFFIVVAAILSTITFTTWFWAAIYYKSFSILIAPFVLVLFLVLLEYSKRDKP